jgi:hypothetical protein
MIEIMGSFSEIFFLPRSRSQIERFFFTMMRHSPSFLPIYRVFSQVSAYT